MVTVVVAQELTPALVSEKAMLSRVVPDRMLIAPGAASTFVALAAPAAHATQEVLPLALLSVNVPYESVVDDPVVPDVAVPTGPAL